MNPFSGRPQQAEQFARIVGLARRSNPFYAEWITNPDDVPVLDRKTVAAHNDQILNGNPGEIRTSGSTAEPLGIYKSRQVQASQDADIQRLVQWLGGPRRPLVIRETWRGIDGPNIVDLNTPIDKQIGLLMESRVSLRVDALTTYPSNMELLIPRLLEQDVDLSFLRRVGLYGEMIPPYLRKMIGTTFPNAQFWSTYSSSEFGPIALSCPEDDRHYHLMTHRLGVELLDDDDRPIPPGVHGRVVITDFINADCPFIRYDTGDLATEVFPSCARNHLPAIADVFGKTRGTLRNRDGERMVWSTLASALRDIPGVRQFQVIQEAIEGFTVRLVCARDVGKDVNKAFVEYFGYRPLRLDIEYVDEILREPSGKLPSAICQV